MIANLSRVMFVIGRLKVAAAALAGSWLITIVADVVLVAAGSAPPGGPAVLALGTTIGQTVVAIPLVFVTRRICGQAAVQGAGHAALAGLAACVGRRRGGRGRQPGGAPASQAGSRRPGGAGGRCAILAFGVVAYLLDDGDLKAVLAWVRRAVRRS